MQAESMSSGRRVEDVAFPCESEECTVLFRYIDITGKKDRESICKYECVSDGENYLCKVRCERRKERPAYVHLH